MSSSRLLSSLQDRYHGSSHQHHDCVAASTRTNKAAAAAVAAARVNANISAAAAQNVQKLAVPDLAQKLMKTQMSLDLKGLGKIAQQAKVKASAAGGPQSTKAATAQKSSRAAIAQSKVSIILHN